MWAVGAGLQQVHWTSPVGPSFLVALLQGNIPQDRKWRTDEVASTIDTYRSLLLQQGQAKLVGRPETALPLFVDELPLGSGVELSRGRRAAEAAVISGVRDAGVGTTE